MTCTGGAKRLGGHGSLPGGGGGPGLVHDTGPEALQNPLGGESLGQAGPGQGAGRGGGRGRGEGGELGPRSGWGAAGELGLGREDSASWRQRAPGAAVRRAGAARAGAERRGEAGSASGGGHCHVFPAVAAAAAAREEVSGSGARGQVGRERRGGAAGGRRDLAPGTGRGCPRRDSAVPATPAPPPRRVASRGPGAEPVPSATRAGGAGGGRGAASPPASRGSGRESPPLRERAAAGKVGADR